MVVGRSGRERRPESGLGGRCRQQGGGGSGNRGSRRRPPPPPSSNQTAFFPPLSLCLTDGRSEGGPLPAAAVRPRESEEGERESVGGGGRVRKEKSPRCNSLSARSTYMRRTMQDLNLEARQLNRLRCAVQLDANLYRCCDRPSQFASGCEYSVVDRVSWILHRRPLAMQHWPLSPVFHSIARFACLPSLLPSFPSLETEGGPKRRRRARGRPSLSFVRPRSLTVDWRRRRRRREGKRPTCRPVRRSSRPFQAERASEQTSEQELGLLRTLAGRKFRFPSPHPLSLFSSGGR